MSACVRVEDTVARWGDDAFAVLVDALGAEPLEAFGERLLAVVTQPVELANGEVAHVTASIGIAVCHDATQAPALLGAASRQLDDVRRPGAGRVGMVVVPSR